MITCDVCGLEVDPSDAHWLHDDGCTFGTDSTPDHVCDCDRNAHPGCCPTCAARHYALVEAILWSLVVFLGVVLIINQLTT